MKAVFDTNVLVDYLNGIDEAKNEQGPPMALAWADWQGFQATRGP